MVTCAELVNNTQKPTFDDLGEVLTECGQTAFAEWSWSESGQTMKQPVCESHDRVLQAQLELSPSFIADDAASITRTEFSVI